jgi:hypothetical protein
LFSGPPLHARFGRLGKSAQTFGGIDGQSFIHFTPSIHSVYSYNCTFMSLSLNAIGPLREVTFVATYYLWWSGPIDRSLIRNIETYRLEIPEKGK